MVAAVTQKVPGLLKFGNFCSKLDQDLPHASTHNISGNAAVFLYFHGGIAFVQSCSNFKSR